MGFEVIGGKKPLTWDEFEKHIKIDIKKCDENRSNTRHKCLYTDWIYRGQACATWKLETSLERFRKDELGIDEESYKAKDYYRNLEPIIPVLNSVTGSSFEQLKTDTDKKIAEHSTAGTVPKYDLLCFLRHHGFPAPILDWTASYYVAAFFAFANAEKQENVAIFAYQNSDGKGTASWIENPIWDQQGHCVKTHIRHEKQKSTYTVCRVKTEMDIIFMKHENALEENPESHTVKKFILKASEKKKVMRMLYTMNINAYTLFGNHESLMNMLAYKELILPKR